MTTTAASIRANTVIFPKLISMMAAGAAALELASIYAADQANWTRSRQTRAQNAFDALGNYTYPDVAAAALMTVTELEQTLSDVRALIQNAVDFARANEVAPSNAASDIEGAGSSMQALKQAALALQQQVSAEILSRDSLVQVGLNNPLPLHLVCLMYGLPYNTAEQLWAVNRRNGVRNPNAVSGRIYVYQVPGSAGGAWIPAPGAPARRNVAVDECGNIAVDEYGNPVGD